jgi:hypothetical protein
MRQPAVAGMFYPGTERGLKRELKDCFRKGPGRSEAGKGRKVIGLISPHAGYTYSGPTAAFGFLAMAEGGLPETVIILGPNHSGMGRSVGVSMEDMKTPMGIMELDGDLAEVMSEKHDELSHLREHSMEVQLPFIQWFSRDVKQVCISMGHPLRNGPWTSEEEAEFDQAEKVSDMIVGALENVDRDVCIIASSDFTHCGLNYGLPIPSSSNAGDFARSRDLPVIENLIKMDIRGALKKKRELGTTACGMGPISAMMLAVGRLGASEAKLLDYRTSYDVSPSHSAVGYASIAVFA